MSKKIISILIISFLILLTLTACGQQDKKENKKLTVYTTVYPLKFFTEQIGGNYVSVYSIYPNGGDEHTFEPTQRDFIKLADSDLFFYIGFGLEGFVSKAKSTLKNENVKMVAIGEKVQVTKIEDELEETHEEDSDEQHDHVDGVNPHLWLDPIYCIEMAESIKDELIKNNPENKKVFESNFSTLKDKLIKLDEFFRKVVETSKSKEFLVSHAAFSYWETRYGLKQIHVLGLSTTDEPSQKQLKNLIDLAKEHQLKSILVEQNVSKKIPDIVKKEINGESLPIHNLAILSDTDVKNNEDYFSISEKNIANLRKALND
ncbi:MAG: adhesin [Bacillales bacterium]|jgi:zinc transport system substrate-binding protein|nr:adhesin [Bacillales bacterium]